MTDAALEQEHGATYQRAFDEALAELRATIAKKVEMANKAARLDLQIARYERAVWSLAVLMGVELPEEVRPNPPRRVYPMTRKRRKRASASSGDANDTAASSIPADPNS